MTKDRTIFILLPAFNEAASLPLVIPQIVATCAAAHLNFRIILCDDGSTDETASKAYEFATRHPVEVLQHRRNRGLGETIRDLFEHAADLAKPGDIIVRMDCDATHNPELIIRLLEKLDTGFDVVNTSRFQPGGGQLGVNLYRRIVSRCANIFMKLVFGIKGLRDYSCGYRAYRAEFVKHAISFYGNDFIQLKGLGFTCTLEKLIKLNILGARFAEIPFVLRYDLKASSSKMISSITTLGYFTMAVLYHWPFGGWRTKYRRR